MKAAAILLLMRLVALGPSSPFPAALPAVGGVTALLGSVAALRQDRLQRLLAYSSIAHAGNLVLGVGAWAALGAHPAAAVAVYFYLVSYLFMSTGAFCFLRVSGLRTRADLRGYARKEPLLAALFAALLLALAGIPPTAGFLGKLLVFWDAIKARAYAPVAAAGLAALVALGYYLALLRAMYFEEPSKAAQPGTASLAEKVLLAACALPAAALGAFPWLMEPLAKALER
jgi:NADH-quinone oxidoreductase subunit N